MAERGETIRIGSYDVKITRPDKVLFPDDRITKRDLITYYRRIAPWILPQLQGRPLTLERFPDGIDKTRIIQKASSSYNPAWVKTVTVKKVGGTVRHVVCENEATLAYLANQACVTPHIWLSRSDRLDYPDQMVFDLDPSGDNFRLVTETAKWFRKILEELGLPAYLKTTGSRGLHVVVPLKRQDDFDSVRSFARRVAQAAADADPEHRTLEQSKAKRRGRVFLDTNRNAYGQTVACAYAVRARRNAPVSVPLDWHELDKKDIRPDGVTIQNVFARLDGTEDPWKDFWRRAVILKKAHQKVEKFNDTRRISQKRQLSKTPEPAGRVRRGKGRSFVVQKHEATRLHYDFRLEIHGVLVSWAVPKGPRMDPASKRFATMTEDHPLEYADFEGVIPVEHYGAGTVMVWDKGTYETEDDLPAEEQLARGEIKLILHGKKLQGAFVLVHMGKHGAKPKEKSRWLLIKRQDEYVNPDWQLEDAKLSRSALTGRTFQEIVQSRTKRKRAA